jgi:hypothetical protein
MPSRRQRFLHHFTLTLTRLLANALNLILPNMGNPSPNHRLLTIAHNAFSYPMRSLKDVMILVDDSRLQALSDS